MKISTVRMITPNTDQPYPRTSSWLRANDAETPQFSSMIAGTIRSQIVRRIETRDDEEDEAEGDRDSCEEAGQRERREVRRHPVERLADREVGAAVTDVVHGEDECALQPEDSGDADEEADHGAEPAERAEQEDEQRDEDVDDEGDGEEMAPVRLVHVPRLADDRARLHRGA